MTREIPERSESASPSLLHNWVSLAGIVLASSSLFAAICLIAIDFFHGFRNPYMGILTYFVTPGFLITGLILVAAGALHERHRRRRSLRLGVPRFPRLDLNDVRQRRTFIAVASFTVVFFLMTAIGSYRTYQFTESVNFCGKTCHSVMKPEFTAYQESPHAVVACVQCHIGPGASWYVKSKISGAYQVYATITNKYPRPIMTPIHNLRPVKLTCEQCHWPKKFFGAAEKSWEHYLPDSTNTQWKIRMLLKIGGGDPAFGPVGGIHWHMSVSSKVEYISRTPDLQDIPWVRITDEHGNVSVYQSRDNPLSPEKIAAATIHVMDCVDCHNRPTHIYHSPVDAVDLAMSTGRISSGIPGIKRQAVQALVGKYATSAAAESGIAETLTGYYRKNSSTYFESHSSAIAAAVAEVQTIYAHNFFPSMKVTWLEYPDNLGHLNFPGCFRCHDGDHVSSAGKVVSHDCTACHIIIAQGTSSGPSSIDPNGLAFQHPVDIGGAWKDSQCSMCHEGDLVD